MGKKKALFTIRATFLSNVGTPSPHAYSYKNLQDDERETASPCSGEIDGIFVIGFRKEDLAFYSTFIRKMRRVLNRKVDIRLLPMLAFT